VIALPLCLKSQPLAKEKKHALYFFGADWWGGCDRIDRPAAGMAHAAINAVKRNNSELLFAA